MSANSMHFDVYDGGAAKQTAKKSRKYGEKVKQN